jgi:glycosyltransferase involved in cell wall biosynthesis
MLTVLIVIARLNVGGTARYITKLSEELPKHEVETFVASGYVQGAELEDPSAQQMNLIRIPSLGRSFNPFKDFLARRQLAKIIAHVKPDIIHTHTFKAGLITRIGKQSVPVIHTFHGHLLDDPEFSGFKSKIIIALEKSLAKKSTKLVTVGNQVADELIKNGIGVQSQYSNIAPGVTALFPTKRTEALANLGLVETGKPIIGWIARVTGVKNPMRVIEVAQAIPDAIFVMAGGGDLLEQVTSAAPGNVRVTGWAKAEDVFGAADIILSTSENEGMPVALIEAQLSGKPVVATDVGAVSEVIEDNETGFVTAKNTGALVEALETLISDPSMCAQMGIAATKRARSLFSVDQMIAAHVALYRSIVK